MITIKQIKENPIIKEAIEKRNISDEILEREFTLLSEYVEKFELYSNPEIFCSSNPNEDFIRINSNPKKPFIELKNCKQEFKIKTVELNSDNYIWDDFNSIEYKNIKRSDMNLNESNKKVVWNELMKRVRDFNRGDLSTKGLYIYGDSGIGKTYITSILANMISEKYEVAHIFLPNFIMSIKNYGSKKSALLKDKFEDIAEAKFLIIDDLGAENITGWSADEILLNILQRRTKKGKFTIITSNYNLMQLESRYKAKTKDLMGAKRLIKRIENTTDLVEMKYKQENK